MSHSKRSCKNITIYIAYIESMNCGLNTVNMKNRDSIGIKSRKTRSINLENTNTVEKEFFFLLSVRGGRNVREENSEHRWGGKKSRK